MMAMITRMTMMIKMMKIRIPFLKLSSKITYFWALSKDSATESRSEQEPLYVLLRLAFWEFEESMKIILRNNSLTIILF